MSEDSFLPSKQWEISDVCKNALLSGGDVLRNGQDRPHSLYATDEENCAYMARCGEEEYTFEAADITSVHIVFCGDINRRTLPGSLFERTHTTRANHNLAIPKCTCQKHCAKNLRCSESRTGKDLSC
ncbi:MAG: hypothetical protein ACI4RB_02305 [Acutalibacteraceae bacterium]